MYTYELYGKRCGTAFVRSCCYLLPDMAAERSNNKLTRFLKAPLTVCWLFFVKAV